MYFPIARVLGGDSQCSLINEDISALAALSCVKIINRCILRGKHRLPTMTG